MSSSNGFVLQVLFTVEPSRIDEFLGHLKPAYEGVATEPQCTFFETTVRREAGEIFLYEVWSESVQWFTEVQMNKDYYKPYREATAPMYIKPLVYNIFERLGPEWTSSK